MAHLGSPDLPEDIRRHVLRTVRNVEASLPARRLTDVELAQRDQLYRLAHRRPSPRSAPTRTALIQPALPPPPAYPPPAHKVYVIRCLHCATFFTDRGMRAILLLRPHVGLFSTDAAPVNVGPLFDGADDHVHADEATRTCSCTSQSLGCHGCGSAIGCAR
jgi:hypothetical protein